MDIVDRIQSLVNEKGLSIAALERNTGLSNGIIKKWKKQSPSCDKIITIANYLNTSIEYLILGTAETSGLAFDAQQLLDYYNQLDKLEKGIVLGKAETLAELAAERAANERAVEQAKKTAKPVELAADEQPEPECDEPEQEHIKIMHSYYKVSAGRGFDLSGDEEWEEIEIPDTHEARKADYALTIQGDSMEPIYYNGDIVLVKKQDSVEIGQIGIFVLDGSGFIKKYSGDRLISLNEKYDDLILENYSDCRCDGRVIGRV